MFDRPDVAFDNRQALIKISFTDEMGEPVLELSARYRVVGARRRSEMNHHD